MGHPPLTPLLFSPSITLHFLFLSFSGEHCTVVHVWSENGLHVCLSSEKGVSFAAVVVYALLEFSFYT